MGRFLKVLAMTLVFAVGVWAERVSLDKAESLAQRFVESKHEQHDGQKRGQQEKPNVKLKYTAAQKQGQGTGTRAAQEDNALYYVFDVEDGGIGGFVIVAGDDVAKPVLGYSENGNYDENNLPPAFNYWMGYLADEIVWAQENGIQQSENTRREWENYLAGNVRANVRVASAVEPLIKTQWDQIARDPYGEYDYPYNKMCPMDGNYRSYTGCVATAMAQLMDFHNWPVRGVGKSTAYTTRTSRISVPSVNFEVAYDWENMLDKYTTSRSSYSCGFLWTNTCYNYYKNWDAKQADAVATLMYHAGVSVKMDYTYGSSGAYSSDVVPALRDKFGYHKSIKRVERKDYYTEQWEAILREQLSAGLPIYYDGNDMLSSGHAFICDGYNNIGQFHFNWGWGGKYDGYFASTVLNTGKDGAGAGSGTYNYNQSAIINIKRGGPIITSHPANKSVDPGQAATFSAAATLNGADSMTYKWQFSANNGSSWSNLSKDIFIYEDDEGATNLLIVATAAMNGFRYRCIVTSDYGTADTSNFATLTINRTPIRDIKKSDGRTGIRLSKNVVSDKAEFEVILPNDKVLEVKTVIYDNTGNVVFETSGKGKLSWNLTNDAGRNVANGTYLIVVEAKGVKGTYAYSAKVGVKK